MTISDLGMNGYLGGQFNQGLGGLSQSDLMQAQQYWAAQQNTNNMARSQPAPSKPTDDPLLVLLTEE